MKKLLAILLLILPSALCRGQAVESLVARIDSIQYRSSDQRIQEIGEIMATLRDKISDKEGEPLVNRIEEIVTEAKDHPAVASFMLQKAIWLKVASNKRAQGNALLLQGLKYAEQNNCPNEKADILMELGTQNRDLGYNDVALDYFLKALDFLKSNNYQLKKTGDYLVNIGDFYYRMGYYEKAADFFEQSTEAGGVTLNDWHQGNRFNTAGLTFKKLKQYDKSLDYFNRSLAIMKQYRAWEGLISGNIGSVYYEMGQLDRAIPLLEKDVSISLETRLFSSAASASQLLAKVSFEKGEIQKALVYYDQALEINTQEPRLSLERDVNEGLWQLYQKTGNSAKALASFQRYTQLKDSLNRLSKVEDIKKLELKHEFERQEQERLKQIAILTQEKALFQNKLRVTIIVGILVMTIAGLLFYVGRQHQRKKRELLQKELELNKRELQLHTEKLVLKTNAMEELQQQLDNIKIQAGVESDSKTELLSRLIESTILTESEWNEFRKTFEQVHHGFFARLRQRHPDLTEGEIRLLALVKLNLSSKEIGNMLGISAESVNKSRYRLRKKLHLEGEANLEGIAENL